MTAPKVSVLLPVYNGAPWLRPTLDAMLRQSLTDFELIAINDGSKDDSLAILRSYEDPRIRVIDQANQGLAATLNRAVGLARARYLARQDQDDVSLPTRLAAQLAFLDAHPEIGVVGTWASIIDAEGRVTGYHKHPTQPGRLAEHLLWNNPFVHSSLMFRREVFETVGLYSTDSARQPPEDYELLSRVARVWPTANLPLVLHEYREVRGSMSRVSSRPFEAKVVLLAAENWAHARPGADPALCRQAAHFLNGLNPSAQAPAGQFSWWRLLRFIWFRGVPRPDRAAVGRIDPGAALFARMLKSIIKIVVHRRALA
jgi:glycosyltransferase involved in cell wall biosynthesis